MQLLEQLAQAFINTFGITQPTDKTRRQAAQVIAAMMVLVVIVLLLAGVLVYRVLHA